MGEEEAMEEVSERVAQGYGESVGTDWQRFKCKGTVGEGIERVTE